MLFVPTELRPSPIQGVGVFLLAPVKKGDLIWRFDARVDRVYTKPELDSLPAPAQEFIKIYAFWHKSTGVWILCGDNAKYCNHAAKPTALSMGSGFYDDIAADDLAIGTELTNNYYDVYENVDVLEGMKLR